MSTIRAAAFYGYEQPWGNVNLIKDCGLVPWLFHKNHGVDMSMVGTQKDEDYSFTAFVPGLRLVPLDFFDAQSKADWVSAHAAELDFLILFGSYYDSMLIAETYKRLRPEGFILLSTDFNDGWVRRIPFEEPIYRDFYGRCDLIGVPTPAIADYIHAHWPWKVSVFRNGYYHFDKEQARNRPFAEKENVILTVGRLGTDQKCTDLLLMAFAKISLLIPDWSLRLVGSIEADFLPFIDALFEEMPDLEDRITFTGVIADRHAMHEEYLRAKVFAMTSHTEGGTNVFCEALTAGCAIASTDFSAGLDAAGEQNECGLTSPINDYDAFADILLTLCRDADLQTMSEAAVKRGESLFQMERVVDEMWRGIPFSSGMEKAV